MNRHQRRSMRHFEEHTDPTEQGAASTPAPEIDESGAAPTPADEGQGSPPPEPTEDEVTKELEEIAGFLKGVEDVSPHLKGDAKTGSDDGKAGAPAAAPVVDKKDGTPPAAAPAPAPDKDLDAEVKALGLKGAAEKRFRDMSAEIKTARPFVETLTKVGIKDAKGLEEVMQTSARGLAWEEAIEKSTASSEQVSSAFTVIRAMNSGDPKLMNASYDALVEQVVSLGKKLGREAPGVYDPLSDHPDLQQEVDNLEITRPRALEIARQRASERQDRENTDRRAAQTQREADDQAAYQHASQAASQELNAFQQDMMANDPQAAAKMPVLIGMLQNGLVKGMHPNQWAAKVATEYVKIKVAAAAPTAVPPRKPAPGAQPMRGGQQPTARMDNMDDTGINPFLRGVADASAGG